jgi:hypothetical protein
MWKRHQAYPIPGRVTTRSSDPSDRKARKEEQRHQNCSSHLVSGGLAGGDTRWSWGGRPKGSIDRLQVVEPF